jgi:hypothetical protein
MGRSPTHVSLRGTPTKRDPARRGRSALGQSTATRYYYIDLYAVLDAHNATAAAALTAGLTLADELAEQAAAAITSEGGSAEVTTAESAPDAANIWKQAVVSSEVDVGEMEGFVDSLLSAAQSEVQGEDGEAYFETTLSEVKSQSSVPSTQQDIYWAAGGSTPVVYAETAPFLVFESVVEDGGNGNDGGNGGGSGWIEPYPCVVGEDGALLIGALPNGLIGNGAEITIEMYSDIDVPDLPDDGDNGDDNDDDNGDGNDDETFKEAPLAGPQFEELSTRIDYVEETSTGYRVVTCADLTPYVSYQAGLTVDTIGAPGCGAPPPDNGDDDNGNGNGDDDNGNGDSDPDDQDDTDNDDTDEGPAPVSAAAVGAALAASVGAGYLLSQ